MYVCVCVCAERSGAKGSEQRLVSKGDKEGEKVDAVASGGLRLSDQGVDGDQMGAVASGYGYGWNVGGELVRLKVQQQGGVFSHSLLIFRPAHVT